MDILKRLRDSDDDIHQENYEYLCERSKAYLARKFPSDLIEYVPLIIYFIEENYTPEVMEILKNLKRLILSTSSDESSCLIIGSNYLQLLKMVIDLYHEYSDFGLEDLTQILSELLTLNDIYLRDESLFLLRTLQVLPKSRYIEFLKPSQETIDKVKLLTVC